MATVFALDFENGTEGGAVNTTNTPPLVAMEANSTFAAQAAHRGALGVQGPAAGTSSYGRTAVSGNTFGFRYARHFSAVPTFDTGLFRFMDSAGSTTYASIEISNAGYLRVRASGSVVWTAAAPITTGWLVVQGCLDAGTSTSTGKITIAYSQGWSHTFVQGPVEITGLNFGGPGVIGRWYGLKLTASEASPRTDDILLTDTYALPGFYKTTPAATGKVTGSFVANPGAWAVNGTGVYTAEQACGDASAATDIRSPGTATNEACTLQLTTPTTDGVMSWEVDLAVNSGATNSTGKVEILQGLGASPTVIASRIFTDLTTTPATKTITLTAAEQDDITDASALAMRLTGNPV